MAIALEHVNFAYDEAHPILSDFSLSLPDEGVLCLFGPSGCGKTTLLRLLARLEQPHAGQITGLEGLRAAVVFQESRLLEWETALNNVALVSPLADKAAARAQAAELLTRIGLETDIHRQFPRELSGGMKQRVAIARALAAQADFLIMDEPFVGLEAALWPVIAQEILTVYAHKPILLVTHIAEQAAVMNAQVIKLDGPPLQIQ